MAGGREDAAACTEGRKERAMAVYQWYPGHMTKARRMMEENIKLVDLVIELADARIPGSSRNPDIDSLCAGKARVLVLNKADLADPACTKAYMESYKSAGGKVIAMDARTRKGMEELRGYVREACSAKLARDKRRGIVGRPLRAMVAGIPNVGKSTFINSFSGKACTKTGNKPGVTKGKQWIRLAKDLELLDTPGILWPKFEDPLIGMRLALAGAINEDILDPVELSLWLVEYLHKQYPSVLTEKYGIAQQTGAAPTQTEEDSGEKNAPAEGTKQALDRLTAIADARKLLKSQGLPDIDRAASLLLDDCRSGRLGRVSLEKGESYTV